MSCWPTEKHESNNMNKILNQFVRLNREIWEWTRFDGSRTRGGDNFFIDGDVDWNTERMKTKNITRSENRYYNCIFHALLKVCNISLAKSSERLFSWENIPQPDRKGKIQSWFEFFRTRWLLLNNPLLTQKLTRLYGKYSKTYMYGLIAKSSISPNKNEFFHESKSRSINTFSSFYFLILLENFQFLTRYFWIWFTLKKSISLCQDSFKHWMHKMFLIRNIKLSNVNI